MSTQDNSGGWSENPLHGKEKPFHGIQPREEHSTGGSCVTLKVYNQEKWSREQIQRVQHKVLTRPDHFWKIIIWDAWINLYQNDMENKVWRTFETAHDLKHTVSSVKHGGVVMGWAPMASSGTGLLVFSDDVTEDRNSQENSEVMYSLSRFRQIEQSWLGSAS